MSNRSIFYGWWSSRVLRHDVHLTGIRHAVGPFLKPMVPISTSMREFLAVIAVSLFLYASSCDRRMLLDRSACAWLPPSAPCCWRSRW